MQVLAWQGDWGSEAHCGIVAPCRLPISLDNTLHCCLPSCIIGSQHADCACTEWQPAAVLLAQIHRVIRFWRIQGRPQPAAPCTAWTHART